MKLQFKYQKFQADAAQSVVDVFAGQNYGEEKFLMDNVENIFKEGQANLPVALSNAEILSNIQKIQRANFLKPSERLEGKYNLTIEMETGVGKTYTYIKTMYELSKHYGWSKFIIVVPSVAIREGVYKTFQVTEDHFAEEYGQKINFFIYNSARLTEIEHFAQDNSICAMIINSQAFNSRSESSRRIRMNLDEFQSRKPLDVIAATNPILIIDEPQSVEGEQTRESLAEFNPLFTLRYSATPREFYNLIYRLDAMDAYNQHLVKKISVTGIKTCGTTATAGYIFLENLNLSQTAAPTAKIQIDCKGADKIYKKFCNLKIGDNIYEKSGGLDEYKNNFIVRFIDGRDNSVEFLNGVKIFCGDVIGNVEENQLRRIQIRETIKAHLEKESQLFSRGIKVLSLFFIDEVAHYKIYDETGTPQNGDFAKIFEQEYLAAVEDFRQNTSNAAYKKYLSEIPAEKTHAGYFSVDNKGKMTNSKISNRREKLSDDISAYDLIMKSKEVLLDLNPQKSPVRFIFSHSALREGWDNPNVFQICTLKQSGSDIRKRQEVGRGLRLCVNQFGERMDENFVGAEVHEINLLTVIAGESYDDFTRKLQTEIAETVADRPRTVTEQLFIDNKIDEQTARKIYFAMIKKDYIDDDGYLTEKYFDDKKSGNLPAEIETVTNILDAVYKPQPIENSRKNNITAKLDEKKFATSEFQALWNKINAKTIYSVEFETAELVKKITAALNKNLRVSKIYFLIEGGELSKIKSKENLQSGTAFTKKNSATLGEENLIATTAKYDIVEKILTETGLTRKTILEILRGLDAKVFSQFANNPEEFILKAIKIINAEKAAGVIAHIKYQLTGENFGADVFTETKLAGKLDFNALATKKNLYDFLIYDSSVEKNFASELETAQDVLIYVKLPKSFYIETPIGKYSPDWAIVFNAGEVQHIYFVAETKGTTDLNQLRTVENSKIHCAKEHFKTVAGKNLCYEVVKSFENLREFLPLEKF